MATTTVIPNKDAAIELDHIDTNYGTATTTRVDSRTTYTNRTVVDKQEYIKTVGYGRDSKLHTNDWVKYNPNED